jgi:hypothetical protein
VAAARCLLLLAGLPGPQCWLLLVLLVALLLLLVVVVVLLLVMLPLMILVEVFVLSLPVVGPSASSYC